MSSLVRWPLPQPPRAAWYASRLVIVPVAVVVGEESKTLTDTGAGADALSVAVDVPLADAGAGSDALSIAAAVTLTDTGAGAETFNASQILRRTLADFTAVSGGTSVNSLSISPTGMQQDDWLLFFVVTVGGATNHTNTAGSCTDLGSQFIQGSTTAISMWKRKAGAGEAGPYTFDAGAARRWAIIASCWIGADPTDVVDGTNVSSEGATAQQLDHNSLTPGAADDWHIIATASNSTAPDDGLVTFGQPSGYDELADIASGHATSANAHASLAVKELPDTSATGVQSVTITGGANRQLAGFEVIIRVPTTGATQITLTDAGAGADTLQVTAAATLAESGSSTDSLQVAAAVTLTDSGVGTDSISVSQAVPKDLTDAGAGSDALSVAAAVPLGEQAAAAEILSVAAAVTLTDAGVGTDTVSVLSAEPKTLTDVGAGADALTVAVTVPLAESGAGADQFAVAQTRTLTDTGAAADALTVSQAKTLTDAGAGADVLRVTAAVPLEELGAAAENAAAAVLASLVDQSAAVDTLNVATVVPVFWATGTVTLQPAATGEAIIQPQTVGTATLQLAAVGEGSMR